MTAFISQLRSLITKVEGLENTVANLAPKPDDWREITSLASRLTEVTSRICQNIESSKRSRKKYALEEVQAIKKQAKPYQDNLANDTPTRAAVFRRNIVLIFEGPKESSFDETIEKSRKEITRQRCATLRGLNSDGLILWAISYTPTSWAGGKMSWDVFYELVNDIEPTERQIWPPALVTTLIVIKDKKLSENPDYELFLKAV
ncbi:hypothetical protein BJX70DRAFT_314353 [Aspergillus crustosus]